MIEYKLSIFFKKNKKFFVLGSIFFVLIILFFIYITENQKFELHNSFERIAMIKDITFNRSLDAHFLVINKHAKFCDNHDSFTKGDLVYNFSKYGIIPILNYLYEVEEDVDLLNSFNSVLEFTEFYASKDIEKLPDMFVGGSENYYRIVDSRYVYSLNKKIIGKSDFNRFYYNYKKSSDIDTIFVNMVSKKAKLSKNEVRKGLLNYDKFYHKYKNSIINAISDDLYCFGLYLYNNRNNLVINEENVLIHYKLRKEYKINYGITRYNNWLYSIDLDSIWDELDKYGYPILYM